MFTAVPYSVHPKQNSTMAVKNSFMFLLIFAGLCSCDALLPLASKTENFAHTSAACVKPIPAKSRFIHNTVDMMCLKCTREPFISQDQNFNDEVLQAEDHKSFNKPQTSRIARFSAPPLSFPRASLPFAADFIHQRPLSVSELSSLIAKATNSAKQLSGNPSARQQAEICDGTRCHDLPRSCCDEESQVVTPLNATSAISGKQVTVAQYPGLFIQTVVFSKCRRDRCSFIRGACRQKFSPYLLMTVHPPGPVTIFGQDYILVESGCACEPELDDNNRASLLAPNEFLDVLSKDKVSGDGGKPKK